MQGRKADWGSKRQGSLDDQLQEASPFRMIAEGWTLCITGTTTAISMMLRPSNGSRGIRSSGTMSKWLVLGLPVALFVLVLLLWLSPSLSREKATHNPPAAVDAGNHGNQDRIERLDAKQHHSHDVALKGNQQWDGDTADRIVHFDMHHDTERKEGKPAAVTVAKAEDPTATQGNGKTKSPGTGCAYKTRDNDDVWITALGRKLPPNMLHHDLAEKLEQHSALQHMMCRRQSGFQAVRALVFACPLRRCLGFTQGLRGMMLSYIVAVMTNRAFFARVDSWMDFHSHLQVSTSWRAVDWSIGGCTWAQMQGETKLKGTLERVRPLNYMQGRDPRCERIHNVYGMRPYILGLVSDLDVNCIYKVLAKGGLELSRGTHQAPLGLAFSRLFTFSDEVLSGEYRLQQEYSWQTDKSICIHVRTGAFLNYDQQGHGHRNVADFWQCARMLERAVGLDTVDDVSWLVISDNDDVQHSAAKFLNDECQDRGKRFVLSSSQVIGENGGAPQHDKDANQAGMKRMLLDFRLLSQCQYSVLSKSSFSVMASSVVSEVPLTSKHHVLVTEQEKTHKGDIAYLKSTLLTSPEELDSFIVSAASLLTTDG